MAANLGCISEEGFWRGGDVANSEPAPILCIRFTGGRLAFFSFAFFIACVARKAS